MYRPRRRGKVGCKPQPRLVAPKDLCSAQAVKVRNKVGHVVEVKRRAVYGGPRRFGKPWRLRQLGTTAQTAFMERWYGALRGLVAPLRRRTRCLSWSHTRHRGKVWLMVSLYNFVMPRSDVHCGHTRGVGLPLEDGAVAPGRRPTRDRPRTLPVPQGAHPAQSYRLCFAGVGQAQSPHGTNGPHSVSTQTWSAG